MAYPNALVKGYLTATGQLTPEMRMKIDENIVVGHQKLLTFEVDGGGFNWWANDKHALVWLTAYGIMEFADMARVTEVDRGVIDRAAAWLQKVRHRDGTWTQAGRTHGERIEHLPDGVTVLTAYVAWALGEAGFADRARDSIAYLESKAERTDDAYALAMIVNALVANDSPRAAAAARRLARMAQVESDVASWGGSGTLSYARGGGADLEATGLATYALFRSKTETAVADMGAAWLIKRRDAHGGWGSTQATILAIKALIEQAKAGGRGEGTGAVSLVVNGRPGPKFEAITDRNNDVVQQVDVTDWVRPGENTFEVTLDGRARLSYQVAGRCYVPWRPGDDRPAETSPLSIDVTYDKERLLVTEKLRARVRLDYRASSPTFMVIAEVGVPPGFAVDVPTLEKLVADGKIARFGSTARRVTLYFGEVRPGTVEVEFDLKPKYAVKVKTEPATAYEYYSPERRGESRPRAIEVTEE